MDELARMILPVIDALRFVVFKIFSFFSLLDHHLLQVLHSFAPCGSGAVKKWVSV